MEFPLLRLPNDLLTEIIKQLDYETINSIRKVSRCLRDLCQSKFITETYIKKTSSFRNDNVKLIEKNLRDIIVRNLPDGSGLKKLIPRLNVTFYRGNADESFENFKEIPEGCEIDYLSFTIAYEYGSVSRQWRSKNQINKARYRGELYQHWWTPFARYAYRIDGYLEWKLKVLGELKLKFPYLEPFMNKDHDGGFCYIFCGLERKEES